MKFPVYIVDIIGEVIQNVIAETGFSINYVYGLNVDILENLKMKDESMTLKDTKYPLIALYMPIAEKYADGYPKAYIRKIVIATLTDKDDLNPDRYDKNFRPTLYPVYTSFMKFLCRHPNIIEKNPETVPHTKTDFVGKQPVSGVNDFIDSIQLDNLILPFTKTKTC